MKVKLPELNIHIQVRRKNELLADYREPGHSFTRNAWNWLFAVMSDAPGDDSGQFGAGKMTSRQASGYIYDGAGYTPSRYYYNTPHASGGMTNSDSDDDFGIVVGGSDAAFDIDDYKLASLITHGSGSGQLSYMPQAAAALDYDSYTWTATHTRQFSNLSGAEITVKEVGLYAYMRFFYVGAAPFCFARDVLATAAVVPDETILTVQYEISMDFSDIDA